MATFYVTHHLYPDNPQLFVVDVKQIVKIKGEPGTAFWKDKAGEHFWEVAIYTSGMDSEGETLGPYWIDMIESEATVHDLINARIETICSDIDWTKSAVTDIIFSEEEDRYAPVVYWTYPSDGQLNVPIDSKVIVRLKDFPPAKGIDINTLVFKVDGYELNPTVYGHKYDYVISYKPQIGN